MIETIEIIFKILCIVEGVVMFPLVIVNGFTESQKTKRICKEIADWWCLGLFALICFLIMLEA